MNEKALLFGPGKSLVGIVTEPAGEGPAGARPGVIILNAGVLHRVGPNRVHVQLARTLARAGFAVLRFDLSGIGDSRPREDNLAFAESALRETREAMDFLSSSRGLQKFALIGICSGADNALQAACGDPRVVAAALIDGYNLPTVGRFIQFHRKRLLSPRSWLRLVFGRSELWSTVKAFISIQSASRTTSTRHETILPSRHGFVSSIQSLAERGVDLCFVYTWDSPAYYNYRRVLRKRIDAWPADRKVRVEYMNDSDHIFTLLSSQRRLVSVVQDWASGLTSGAPS
jgi:dienelactone hydrolase